MIANSEILFPQFHVITMFRLDTVSKMCITQQRQSPHLPPC